MDTQYIPFSEQIITSDVMDKLLELQPKTDALFYDAGKKPYLEEHHVKRLADGGKDAMDNVVAICPNCHRKIHVLNDEVDTIVLEGIAEQNEKQYERLLAYAKRMLK